MRSFINVNDLKSLKESFDNQEIVSVKSTTTQISSVKRKYNKNNLTKEQIIELAISCENKGEFIKKHYNIYTYLNKTSFKKEIMALIPRKIKWTPELLIGEARKYNSRSQWLKNNASSYNIANRDTELYKKCVEHMGSCGKFGEPNTVKKYTYEIVKDVYSKYNTINELFSNDRNIYNAAIRNGWHKEFSKDMQKYVTRKQVWTYERVKEEALKYNSIKEFREKNRSAYFKAVYSKWLVDVIGHMTGGNTKWTLEKIVDRLSKHDKNSWYKDPTCRAAYYYMKRHNISDKVLGELKKKEAI
jgi:hypothetical protein